MSKLTDILRSLEDYGANSVGQDVDETARLIQELFEDIINGEYELSITDLELHQHQTGQEIPVLSKTELLKSVKSLAPGRTGE